MKIRKETYKSIAQSVPDVMPESGGILGGLDETVSTYESDRGRAVKRQCCYAPDVLRLNKVIGEWRKKDVRFLGVYHTHFFGVNTLSDGDAEYIYRIMSVMPREISKLYFPIVVLPERKMVSYVAVRTEGNVTIIPDTVHVVE